MILLLPAALASTLEVGTSKTYATITAALAVAKSGDTVKVYDGTYAEDLDLRGRGVTVVSVNGPSATTITPSNMIHLDDGSFEGFRIDPAPSTGFSISGATTLKNVVVNGPSTYGVYVSTGSPIVEEVVVIGAGLHAFLAGAGSTPTFLRSVAIDPATAGFAIQSRATVRNSISLGGTIGFKTEGDTAAVFDHLLAIGQTSYGVSALVDGTFSNSIFLSQVYLAKCSSSEADFPNGISSPTMVTAGCAAGTGSAMSTSDPALVRYASELDLWSMDLRLTAGSPARDAGNDTDADGSDGDLGPFGGAYGVWNDQDGDGTPDVFDCADHDGDTYAYATEIGDGVDNDCDGTIDEGVPIDTGDPGDSGDTGDSEDSGETGVIDTGPKDLDGDGYVDTIDCDEHNARTYPGAPELSDYADNDCDDFIDEGTVFGDSDIDGWTLGAGDCNDLVWEIHPGAAEPTESNGIDEDCDGVDDFGRSNIDTDGDGFSEKTECNDADADIHPNIDDPLDLVDNDCDGQADEDDLQADADGDGVKVLNGDCDDHDTSISPSAVDIPDDFIDQDCTGTDNYDVDRDGDPAPISGGTDCDDTRSNIRPGFDETCFDGMDNNCDGTIDEGCALLTDTGAKVDDGACGCASATNPGVAAILLVTLLARRRRVEIGTRS